MNENLGHGILVYGSGNILGSGSVVADDNAWGGLVVLWGSAILGSLTTNGNTNGVTLWDGTFEVNRWEASGNQRGVNAVHGSEFIIYAGQIVDNMQFDVGLDDSRMEFGGCRTGCADHRHRTRCGQGQSQGEKTATALVQVHMHLDRRMAMEGEG